MDTRIFTENTTDDFKMSLKELGAFVEALVPMRTSNEEFFRDITNAVWTISDSLFIGRLRVVLDDKDSILGHELMNNYVFFNRECTETDEEKSHRVRCDIYGGGSADIIFYPFKEHEFTESEKVNLSIVGKLIFSYAGRFRLSRALKQMANMDILTRLPNIYGFYEQIDKLIAANEISKYTAFYFNLYEFKTINDSVGQKSGDKVIKIYARTIAGFCDGNETIARIGGDNFVALILREKSEKFLKLIDNVTLFVELERGKKQIEISTTAGCYDLDENVHSSSDVMMAIANALQIAKETKKRYLFFTNDIAMQMMRDQKASMLFESSIEAGEFVPYFQPKIDMKTGRICGAEALARWMHEGKLIPPNEFIPALERDGRITKLDFEILKSACALISKWKKEGRDVPNISINMSRKNLKNRDFLNEILMVLGKYRTDPSAIVFEFTETYEYEEIVAMEDLFKELRLRGIKTTIDDFGTGNSSLGLISRVKPDILKLDKGLVSDFSKGEEEAGMIKGVINLAFSMNIQVIAEGVETEEQKDKLLKYGCEQGQGFLYEKPIPAADFEERYLK